MSAPQPTRPLNATAASILGFLLRGPHTGWDLVQAMHAELGDFWNVTRSQVYRELKALEADGRIAAGPPESREKRPYTITAAGTAAFDDWLAATPGDDIIRVPLLLAMFFSARLDRAALGRFVATHRAVHEERLAGYRSVAEALAGSGGEEAERLRWVVDYGIRHTEAVLGWMDELPVGP